MATLVGLLPERTSRFEAAVYLNAHMPEELTFSFFSLWWDHGRWCEECGGSWKVVKGDHITEANKPQFMRDKKCPMRHIKGPTRVWQVPKKDKKDTTNNTSKPNAKGKGQGQEGSADGRGGTSRGRVKPGRGRR